jgi:hypothetical protein
MCEIIAVVLKPDGKAKNLCTQIEPIQFYGHCEDMTCSFPIDQKYLDSACS